MENTDSKYCSCLYYSANAFSRVLSKMADEEFASTGLTSSYAFLLMTVIEKPGVQPKEISCQLQLTPSTVTRLIEKMELRGYLTREVVGRSTEVYPTEEGKAMQPKIKAAWKSLYERYSTKIGKQKSDQMAIDIHNARKSLEE